MSMAASSRLVRNAKDLVLAWASYRLGSTFREPCIALGVLNRAGLLVGAVIYNDFDARNIELTAVGPFAFRKDVAREIFAVAFIENDCRRISLTVPEKHIETIDKALRWGWKPEGIKRDYYDDDNAVILGMTRDECRFLKD